MSKPSLAKLNDLRAFLHRAITYPTQYGSQQPLWASLGFIANMILDAIEKRTLKDVNER